MRDHEILCADRSSKDEELLMGLESVELSFQLVAGQKEVSPVVGLLP
jgi:hypothetical protein